MCYGAIRDTLVVNLTMGFRIPSQKLVAVLLLTTTLQNCRQSNIPLHYKAGPKVSAHQQTANTIAASNAFTSLQLVQTSANAKLPTPTSFAQTYLSAQGHQVCFLEQSGVWRADVQDIWKGVQHLSVICQPKKIPKQAIQELMRKIPDQHKYCVHILQTHKSPWSLEVVYVGALGVRGRGNASSSPKSNPDTHKNGVQTTTGDGDMSISTNLPSFATQKKRKKL